MKKYTTAVSFFLSLFLIFTLFPAFASAAGENAFSLVSNNRGGIVSVSYRGDSAAYPKNSLEGILSAAKKGADMISVSVRKTKDGEFVLCESGDLSKFCKTDEKSAENLSADEITNLYLLENSEKVSKCTVTLLDSAVKTLGGSAILVLDNAWSYRDEISAKYDETQVMFRTDKSSKEIERWKAQSASKIEVIGIYDGNIIFNAQSHLSRLSKAGFSVVQYQSKNYFNVMYNELTAKKYSAGDNARALAPMFSADLCGQREDNVSGWDEMIKRGFSVIETNNIGELAQYINQCEQTKDTLEILSKRAESVNIAAYTEVSAKNLEKAKSSADECLANSNTSLGELESAKSELTNALNNLVVGKHNDTQKGSLNITAGKVASAVIFGLLLLAGEIYVFKMRKKHSN